MVTVNPFPNKVKSYTWDFMVTVKGLAERNKNKTLFEICYFKKDKKNENVSRLHAFQQVSDTLYLPNLSC